MAVELAADAVGLNFHSPSPRSVSVQEAREVSEEIRGTNTEPIGLFVNHSLSEIVDAVESCGLKVVQLHGDETPEFLAEVVDRLPEVRIVRAFRVGGDGCAPMAASLGEYNPRGVRLWGCLIDAKVGGAYGGTGHTAPWDLLRREYRFEEWPPLILAGGLHPDNVAAAIRAVQPWGVDVSSGIESSPGVKDHARMRAFVTAARRPTPR